MKIEPIDPLPLSDAGKSPIAFKKRRDEGGAISRKRDLIETREATPTSRQKKCEEETGELFPDKKRSVALPERGTENIDFNRNVWTSPPPRSTKTAPVVGMKGASPGPKFEHVERDPLLQVPKVGGYYIAQIVGKTYELHLFVQGKQLEVFKMTQAGVRKLRDDQIDLIRNQIENRQIEAKWTYWKNVLAYFGITANATVGMGILLAENVLLGLGTQMVVGSALSLCGKLARDFTDKRRTGAALSLAGFLLSIYGVQKNLTALLDNDLPQRLATSVTTFQKVAGLGVSYRQGRSQASFFSNRAKQVTNEFKRKVAEKEMEQIVAGLGKKDQAEVIAAAAKTISIENQITADIARGANN